VVVVGVLVGGYFAWQQRAQGRADAALASAILIDDARVGPPAAPGSQEPAGMSFATAKEKLEASQARFKAVADEFPSTDAGLFARYREAGAWMALGNAANASAAYQQVIDHAGSKVYGQMAKLGLAEAQVSAGQIDPAINTFKEMAQLKDGPLPVDGILIRLAQVYKGAGKTTDAEQTLNRILTEFPDSSFSADARRELDLLKKS
jgi:predicted negative regulator of RcsB-dependent stress response